MTKEEKGTAWKILDESLDLPRRSNTATGPELDALVAEKIMGWHLRQIPLPGGTKSKRMVWVVPETDELTQSKWTQEDFRPSTDMGPAIEVALKAGLCDSQGTLDVVIAKGHWAVLSKDDPEKIIGYGESPPHAICVAALGKVKEYSSELI